MASVSIAARESLRFSALRAQAPSKIAGGSEHPSAGDPHEIDAAALIKPLQFFHDRADIRAVREAAGDRGFVDRLGGSEHHRLGDADVLRRYAGATASNRRATLSVSVTRPTARLIASWRR